MTYISEADRGRWPTVHLQSSVGALARGALGLIALATCLGVSPGFASEARWRAVVGQSGCFKGGLDQQQLVMIAAGWRGAKVGELGTLAGVPDLARQLRDAESSGDPARLKAIIGRVARPVLAATAPEAEQLGRDIATHRDAVCPLLHAQAGKSLPELARDQDGRTSLSQPYLAVAQYALSVQGCDIGDIDGAFGPRSRTAWQSAARNLGLAEPVAGRVPSPNDVAGVLRQPYRRNLCAATPAPATQPPLLSFARLYVGAPGQACDQKTLADAIKQIMPIVLGAPEILRLLVPGFCDPQERIVYEAYLNATDGGRNAAEAARIHLVALDLWKQSRAPQGVDNEPQWRSDALVDDPTYLRLDKVARATRLSELIGRFEQARDVVRKEATAAGQFLLATMLLEGHAEGGQRLAHGVSLMMEAARGGSNFALLRTAQMLEQGYGVKKDLRQAMASYQTLAGKGQIAGMLALARLNETDGDGLTQNPREAERWYRALFAAIKTDPADGSSSRSGIGNAIKARLMEGSTFLSSTQGQAMLLQAASGTPELAREIGDAYGCVECGGAIDLQKAAQWYRAGADAEDLESSYRLARLLIANPSLATSPDEGRRRLAAAAEKSHSSSSWLQLYYDAVGRGRPIAELSKDLAAKLREPACTNCRALAHQIAIGGIDDRIIRIGFEFLRDAVATPAKAGEESDESRREAITAYVDVLAFYGAFEAAREALASSAAKLDQGLLGYGDSYTARNAVLRRLITNRGFDAAKGSSPMKRFLELAAARGDPDAALFLEVLATPPAASPQTQDGPQEIARLNALYQQQLARGGKSQGLAAAARTLADAETRSGSRQQAITLELAALNTEIDLENTAAIWKGPLPSALARVCLYSKASRRVFDFGNVDLAIVLAKTAVNELQDVRMKLRELPQQLQLCFRDMIADHYRWLADLFISQGRTAEAERVLGFLKDFETFQFLDRDLRFNGEAFERLPLTPDESRAQRAIGAITTPVPALAMRERELRLRRTSGSLTAAEETELAEISRRLQAHASETSVRLAELLDASRAAGRLDNDTRMALLNSVRGRLRNELKGQAAALHFVVLPDRMHAILTLPEGPQIARSWTTLDGAPFSERALDAKIARFRAQLRTPTSDPLPLARELHDLLIKPFAADLAASRTSMLLLSLDRRLRYLPFAALHDGTRFLVEDRRIVVMTEGHAGLGPPSVNHTMSALATTRAYPDFPALKGAGLEATSLVRDGNFGLFRGRTMLDERFTRTSLGDALLFGSSTQGSLGFVHIASHFKVGRTESESFLLLGNGDRLSIFDIRKGMGAGLEFDFGDVDLLTLSACDTAYAEQAADGRELESFATAAQRQGSRAVLASLWPISDNSTALLMLRFYELNIAGGLSRDAALAKVQSEFIQGRIGTSAQLAETARRGHIALEDATGDPNVKLLKGYAHPFYWAPFVLLQGLRGG